MVGFTSAAPTVAQPSSSAGQARIWEYSHLKSEWYREHFCPKTGNHIFLGMGGNPDQGSKTHPRQAKIIWGHKARSVRGGAWGNFFGAARPGGPHSAPRPKIHGSYSKTIRHDSSRIWNQAPLRLTILARDFISSKINNSNSSVLCTLYTCMLQVFLR